MTTRPDIHAKAETLIEALPYFQRYAGRSFVVKYGGNAMGDERAAREFAEDVVLLRAVGINPVVVHGGGPQIGAMLEKLGVETTFVTGDGVKDPEFVKQAGQSAADAVISCPCGPASEQFAQEYTDKFGQAPGTYSTEGYDLGTIMVKAVDSGAITRPAMLDYFANYDGQGVARRYQWTPEGELTTSLIWMYKVQ